MRSTWLAGILSPVFVGAILYFIAVLFGVDREFQNSISIEAERWLFSKESFSTQSGLTGKKSSDRLVGDTEVGGRRISH